MRKLILGTLLMQAGFLYGQLPEDVLRYGFPLSGGTARNQAIGGAGGSLGGDISAAYINPAGLGLYKNKELVFSPGFSMLKSNYNYLGSGLKSTKDNLNYGTSGIVLGKINDYSPDRSNAFAITINQTASYKNNTAYTGYNNYSSLSEQYLEEATQNLSGNVSDIVRGLESGFIFGTSLAYGSYLIDTVNTASGGLVIQSQVPIIDGVANSTDSGVIQHNAMDSRGGVHEIAFSYANNIRDKFSFGISLGIPIYSYTKEQTYREDDATKNPDNNFSFFEYKENYTTNGVGLNAKLGIIYRPIERLRLGLALHTPTITSLTDKVYSSLTANTENFTKKYPDAPPQPVTTTSDALQDPNSIAGRYEYQMKTPMRLLISGSWVLNEINDIKQQKGFITTDLEYVPYGTAKYSAAGENTDDNTYYNSINKIIKDRYKGAINAKIGGELKFNTVMVRAGFAYYGNPYRDKQLNASRILLSGGLGYRNKGFFTDLTYVYAYIKDSHIPYYLSDKANAVANGKNTLGNIIFTIGIKL